METHDIVILGTIIAVSNGLIALGDRLWKKPAASQDAKPEQSIVCGFQHASLQKAIDEQTISLKDLVKALRDMVEDGKLRHQIICDRLDRMNAHMERIENNHLSRNTERVQIPHE